MALRFRVLYAERVFKSIKEGVAGSLSWCELNVLNGS